MPQLGPAEVLVILVVALLVFGPKRLPEVGRQVGRGLRELRKIQDTVRDEINDVLHHDGDDAEPPRYASAPPVAAPSPVPAPASGRHAPSRFRVATPSAIEAAAGSDAASDTTRVAATPVPTGRPAHAPSRSRAPGH
jgi:TatA/E family protein of Tat protein translocase